MQKCYAYFLGVMIAIAAIGGLIWGLTSTNDKQPASGNTAGFVGMMMVISAMALCCWGTICLAMAQGCQQIAAGDCAPQPVAPAPQHGGHMTVVVLGA